MKLPAGYRYSSTYAGIRKVKQPDLALIVSDYVYHNIVSRHPSLVSPTAFHRVRFQVKHTRAPAWTYIPPPGT